MATPSATPLQLRNREEPSINVWEDQDQDQDDDEYDDEDEDEIEDTTDTELQETVHSSNLSGHSICISKRQQPLVLVAKSAKGRATLETPARNKEACFGITINKQKIKRPMTPS
ncbi:unnamed protein product [[Candida] boidinii]|uniref:Unnamed protein product n=1 Tax=Candida boidinii TaxID=5477 RepID=A0A9W6T2U9_CANBO|nr:unnamed protein product [[Candida] boidinii]GMF51750.1 unnamed protein product [[Candida] boidinii]GMF98952.1 unnamed protein product [[Candida] boidinii]